MRENFQVAARCCSYSGPPHHACTPCLLHVETTIKTGTCGVALVLHQQIPPLKSGFRAGGKGFSGRQAPAHTWMLVSCSLLMA